jgi:hypothetical protein
LLTFEQCLYTAITRARVNCWIVDFDEVSRRPAFTLFSALGLVDTVGSTDKESAELNQRMFSKTTSTADWRAQVWGGGGNVFVVGVF